MIRIWICAMCLTWFGAITSAETVLWKAVASVEQKEKVLTVDNGRLSVSFREPAAWTIKRVMWDKTEIVGPYGANGTVASLKNGWAGTWHGGETLSSLYVEISGKEVPFSTDLALSGSAMTLVKKSAFGPFTHEARFEFPAGKDLFIETHLYRITGSTDDVNSIYAFMFCLNNGFKEWLAFLPNGTLEGIADKDDAKFSLKSDIEGIVMYNREKNVGVVFSYPECYKGSDSFKNSIWDRKNNNKFYFKPLLDSATREKGHTFSFRVTVAPFASGENAWKERGKYLFRSLRGA